MLRVLLGSVELSVDIYINLQQNMKPTPNKSCYLFNIRDLNRVFQGIQTINKQQLQTGHLKIVRLVIHEVVRVFYDRIFDVAD